MNVWDYVNEILVGKKQLIVDETTEKEYNPFITNRSLSYHRDCIMQANEINMRSHIDNKMQFDFYLNIVRSQKRPFAKWVKSEVNEDKEIVKNFFNISDSKATEVLRILSKEQILELKEKTDTGGLLRK